MWLGLIDLFDAVAANPDDRVLVITGAGDGFCSGADLADGGTADAATGVGGAAGRHAHRRAGPRSRLHELAKPTIAAVNGVAAGAGCNLALGCDLIVASDRARFSEIFSKRGLAVDFGGSWVLPRLVGMHRAKELVFLADVIDATEAERIGLVNRVVAHEQLGDDGRASSRRGSRTCRRSRSPRRSACSNQSFVGLDGRGDRGREHRAGADVDDPTTPRKRSSRSSSAGSRASPAPDRGDVTRPTASVSVLRALVGDARRLRGRAPAPGAATRRAIPTPPRSTST